MSFDAPLPDFVAALEEQLRAAADTQAQDRPAPVADVGAPAAGARPPRRTRRWARPRSLALGGLVAAALVVVVLVMGFAGRTPPAVGGPPILNAPRVADPAVLRKMFRNSMSVGPQADFANARAVRMRGGVAYLIRSGVRWCLTAPDPALPAAQSSYGVACTSGPELRRVGVSLMVGDSFIATVAGGVKAPTVTLADGAVRTVRPNVHGIVTVSPLPAGATVRLFGTHGPPSTFTLPLIEAPNTLPMPKGRGYGER